MYSARVNVLCYFPPLDFCDAEEVIWLFSLVVVYYKQKCLRVKRGKKIKGLSFNTCCLRLVGCTRVSHWKKLNGNRRQSQMKLLQNISGGKKHSDQKKVEILQRKYSHLQVSPLLRILFKLLKQWNNRIWPLQLDLLSRIGSGTF